MPRKSQRPQASEPSKVVQPEFVHQFLVVLIGTDPLVWRRVQVPLTYSFWDLHVAIQDAMGWLDYHLHEFRVLDARNRFRAIGIPTGEEIGPPPMPGWRVHVSDYFNHQLYERFPALYLYDFGDGWEHALVYEGEQPIDETLQYPRCIGGARRCPPEDCGGIHGYQEFLAAIADPRHPEHEALLTWAGGDYMPDAFDPAGVTFDDPLKRWKIAFERSSG